jgi:hypothetical protein
MVSSNNDRYEVRPDESMPEVTDEPNRHTPYPRKAIVDSVQRSDSKIKHGGGAPRACGGVSVFRHSLSIVSMDGIVLMALG